LQLFLILLALACERWRSTTLILLYLDIVHVLLISERENNLILIEYCDKGMWYYDNIRHRTVCW
jgi:hypothetical protein